MHLPNVSAKTFSFSAVLLGYLLIDDLTANEQNALGNWLMLVAQLLCTNAYYKEVRQERGIEKDVTKDLETDNTIEMLEKMVKAMQKEIDDLKVQIQKNDI